MYNELKIGFDLMSSKENNTSSNNTGTIIEEKIEVKKKDAVHVSGVKAEQFISLTFVGISLCALWNSNECQRNEHIFK